MYAVIQQGGRQYRVQEGDTIVVDNVGAEDGSSIDIDVLMLGGDEVKIGTPTVEGAKVTAKVVSTDKGDKRTTFKYRARKRYRRHVGFRPTETTLQITAIKG